MFLDLTSPEFSTRGDEVKLAREKGWCAETPYGLAVLRHREAGQLLRHPKLRQGSYAWPDKNNLTGSFARFWKRSIIGQEGDRHQQLRTIVLPALSADYVKGLEPTFTDIAITLADQLTDQPQCEFISQFSAPFAGQAICVLLGLDTKDWRVIAEDASNLGLAMGVECKTHEAVFNAACDRLMELSEQLVGRARSTPGENNFVSRLVDQYDRLGTLDHQALLDMIVISIFGGVDTTKSQLGFAIALFIQNRDQWQKLRANRELVGNAVEEIIRAHPTTTWATREAVEDFDFGGRRILAGQTLHMLVHACARDPLICDNPAFDIEAKRKIHFGFGGGAHHCIGHLVARTDMACALSVLADRFCGFRYSGQPKWLPDSGNTSPVKLPISCEIS